MADWVTISSLATAGGTLVLAIATFSSVKSANRSARVAEQSLLVGMRPVLIPSRDDDPTERLRFGDEQVLTVPGHGGALFVGDEAIYFAMALRNGGSGLAVIHGWCVGPRAPVSDRPDLDDFRSQQIDLYIPAGDTGYWLGAMRDRSDPRFHEVRRMIQAHQPVQIDLLYGDYEGGQRTIARFVLARWPDDEVEGKRATV
ncbi:MAG: hypothetical protein ACLPTJ_04905, partial [Solirubrobacteraceae bacterium]